MARICGPFIKNIVFGSVCDDEDLSLLLSPQRDDSLQKMLFLFFLYIFSITFFACVSALVFRDNIGSDGWMNGV